MKARLTPPHGQILSWLSDLPPSRVLDLGCSHGVFDDLVRKLGHTVVGLDVEEHDGVREKVDEFYVADLAAGIPEIVGGGYDVILAADILEHLPRPHLMVREAMRRLRPGGLLITSVPNFGHWYPRIRTFLGLFDYDTRGILDRTHLRFFTKKSYERLLADEGCVIVRRSTTGLPIDVLSESASGFWRMFDRLDRLAGTVRPQLFGYQLLYEVTAKDDTTLTITDTVRAPAQLAD